MADKIAIKSVIAARGDIHSSGTLRLSALRDGQIDGRGRLDCQETNAIALIRFDAWPLFSVESQ